MAITCSSQQQTSSWTIVHVTLTDTDPYIHRQTFLLLRKSFSGLHNEWDDNGQDNANHKEGKDESHLEVLPPHLFLEVPGPLLEDVGLLIELVALLSQRLGLFRVLEHAGNVVLHLVLDLIDLAEDLLGLVNVRRVLVAFAKAGQESLGLFRQRVGRRHLGIPTKLVVELAVHLREHLDGHTGRVPQTRNDGKACWFDGTNRACITSHSIRFVQ